MKTFIPEAVFSALAAGTLLLPITMPNGARAANPSIHSVQFDPTQNDGLNIAAPDELAHFAHEEFDDDIF